MATIDMTHRKLNFPPRFLPYLEKHRIFELFHECVELLVQVRPKDHIQFLKNVLPCAALKKDKPRVVFWSPRSFDRETFAQTLADCLGIQNITRMTMEMLTREKLLEQQVKVEEITESVEEESCICPGEGEISGEGGIFYPLFYPGETYEEEPYEEAKDEEEEKPPCICVCPCVENQHLEEGKDGGAGGTGAGGGDETNGEWEGEGGEGGLPCEPRKHKRKKKTSSSVQNGLPATVESSSVLEVDYSLLADCELGAKGWILEDFPQTGEEAEELSALGVIPTHALRIITDEDEERKDREHKWQVISWTKAYKFVPVLEIRVGERTIQELSKDMCNLLQVMPHRHAPMLPRVVLIGSRGSGVTTQGQKLSKKYGLVHVEFELVVERALQQDDDMIKLYKQQLATRPDPEVEAFILEKVLLTSACRNRGWVLTGYPRNIDQMRMLDIIATPPNRIIFVEVPARECFVRLFYRKTDPCLGDEYKIPSIEPSGLQTYETPGMNPEISNRLQSHPKNDKKQILHDIEQYFIEKTAMMSYCRKTASYVDGNQNADRVFELIEQVLINPSPAQPPRNPLEINYGLYESYERLKKFRLSSGMFFNNLFLNPPERIPRI